MPSRPDAAAGRKRTEESPLHHLAYDENGVLRTWSYGYCDPKVLFLSYAPGDAGKDGYPEISPRPWNWSDWSGYALVRRAGIFLRALHEAGHIDRPLAAVCDLSPKKVPPGGATKKEYLEAWEAAHTGGTERLRSFLHRSPPAFIITCDTWFESTARTVGQRGALHLMIHPDGPAEEDIENDTLHLLDYRISAVLSPARLRQRFEKSGKSPRFEGTPFVGRAGPSALINTELNFSTPPGTDAGWRDVADAFVSKL